MFISHLKVNQFISCRSALLLLDNLSALSQYNLLLLTSIYIEKAFLSHQVIIKRFPKEKVRNDWKNFLINII